MTYLPPDSALHRLRDTEICYIKLHDGRQAEAIWSAEKMGFFYLEGQEARFIPHTDVYEWWPASVKF